MTTAKPLNNDLKVEYNKYGLLHLNLLFKGTVSVIVSDTPGNDDNAKVTTVPFKLLSD